MCCQEARHQALSDLWINCFPAREGVGGERKMGEEGTSVIWH